MPNPLKPARKLAFALLALCLVTFPGRAADAPAFSVKISGKGAPMILIPGLACSGQVWDSTVAHFKDKYACHVLTLAGFAGQPPIKAPMLDAVTAQLAEYIRTNKIEHPVIVGHSLGGFLAFSLAATYPQLVGPVISVDGLPFFAGAMNPMATEESAKAMAGQIKSSLDSQSREDYLAQNQRTLATMITDPANIKLAGAWATNCDIPSVGEAMFEMLSTDLRQKVAAIKTPVLLVGADSFATTPEVQKSAQAAYEAQVAKIPNHKVVMDPHSKHFIMYDDPKFLFLTMDGFLKK